MHQGYKFPLLANIIWHGSDVNFWKFPTVREARGNVPRLNTITGDPNT